MVTSASRGAGDMLRRIPATIHLVENRPQPHNGHTVHRALRLPSSQCRDVVLYVGRRDVNVTDQLEFWHATMLTGAVLGMRRIDFRSERCGSEFK